eukprot:scaffold19226_cov75-Phaeocystis_antarctica.AAC.1
MADGASDPVNETMSRGTTEARATRFMLLIGPQSLSSTPVYPQPLLDRLATPAALRDSFLFTNGTLNVDLKNPSGGGMRNAHAPLSGAWHVLWGPTGTPWARPDGCVMLVHTKAARSASKFHPRREEFRTMRAA